MKSSWIVAIVGLALIISLVFYSYYNTWEVRPDFIAMRNYVYGKTSEEKIKEAYEQAKKLINDDEIKRKAEDEERAQGQARDFSGCMKNDAERIRRGGCGSGAIITDRIPTYSSVERLTDEIIMGICLYAKTVREAKKLGCLP